MMTAQESDHNLGSHVSEEAEHATPKGPHRAASYDRGVQIAAAQLRLVTDRRLGKATPDWVKELAQEEPRAS